MSKLIIDEQSKKRILKSVTICNQEIERRLIKFKIAAEKADVRLAVRFKKINNALKDLGSIDQSGDG